MSRVDLIVESKIPASSRCRQLESIFDVPRSEVSRMEWHCDVPLEAQPWNVGLVVGPSGSGKTQTTRQLFGDAFHPPLAWQQEAPVIDSFSEAFSVSDIANACTSVGFSTIPSWLRPFGVLSNGEQFRVDLARRLLELPDPIVVDEFTSVVDRQVAQIGAHAVQKYVRKQNRQFVAVTCHYDVVEWLQPDWIFEPATGSFQWRLPRRRPELACSIQRVPQEFWRLFAPYHYMTAELHCGAACYCLFVGDRPAAFTGIMHFPHPKARNLKSCSRLVTLPDWQGLGLAFVLIDQVAAAYKTFGFHMNTHPAHPSFVRAFDRSPMWSLRSKALQAETPSETSTRPGIVKMRPCATFRYAGPAAPNDIAKALLAPLPKC